MNPMPHPARPALAMYLQGELSWSALESMEKHLSECPACRAEVNGMQNEGAFLGCLRQLAVKPPSDPVLQQLIEHAHALALGPADQTAPHVRLMAGCELLEEKGVRGGLGVVYKVRHPVLKDIRAIKRPRELAHVDRAQLSARFRREVEAVGALRHEHIVRAHDAGEDEEGPYLVMEYLDGESLEALSRRSGQMPVAEACEMACQAAVGLQVSHEGAMVHRDIKP